MKYLLVGVFFAIIITMCAFTCLGITSDLFLYGATANAEKPNHDIGQILDGTYQSGYDAWYKENYPYRDYVIKTYNQFKYTVFNKSSNSNLIFIDDAILETGYLNNTLNIDVTEKVSEMTDKVLHYAENIFTIQRELEKQNKMFLYIITPSKDYLYLDNLPLKYALNDNTDINENNYTLLAKAFDTLGVNYYDAYDAIDQVIDEGKYQPYHTTGTHWNFYASAVAVQGFINKLNNIYDCNLPGPVSRDVQRVTEPQGEDCDLYKLLNIWSGQLDKEYYHVDVRFEAPDDFVMPNIMYFGTSFQYQLLHILEGDGTYKANDVYKYFQRRQTDSGFYILENGVYDIDFSDMVFNNDLFIIENVSSSITEPHEIFAENLAKHMQTGTSGFEVLEGDGDINIAIENTDAIIADAEEVISIPLTLSNNTTNTVLSSSYKMPFYLSYHILDENGKVYLHDGIRTSIEDVFPLSALETFINIIVPSEKGRYTIQVSFVQENCVWGENYLDTLPVELELIVE